MGEAVKVVYQQRRKRFCLRWIDPESGRLKQKSVGPITRKQAENLAAQLEADLQEGRYAAPSKVTWSAFRTAYEGEKVPSLANATGHSIAAMFNCVERLMHPLKLADVTATMINTFQARLRREAAEELARRASNAAKHKSIKCPVRRVTTEASIAKHLRHLKAALRWAKSMRMVVEVPSIQMPRRAKGAKLMKGRPVTTEEYERMLSAVEVVRPRDALGWQRFLTGLWLSGLRLSEALQLAWDDDAPIYVDLLGRHPRIAIRAEAEKAHRDRLLPMTPDFAAFILTAPKAERTGLAFKLNNEGPIAIDVAARIISRIGKKAGVVVDKAAGKFASAHDLRRSFGTRWASRVKPATLQLLMRHESIQTTLAYYVAIDADDVANELWREHGAVGAQLASNQAPRTNLGGALGGAENNINSTGSEPETQIPRSQRVVE